MAVTNLIPGRTITSSSDTYRFVSEGGKPSTRIIQNVGDVNMTVRVFGTEVVMLRPGDFFFSEADTISFPDGGTISVMSDRTLVGLVQAGGHNLWKAGSR